MSDLRAASARLLVADDNKVNRLLLTRNLELMGHSVACAENGRVALELLRRDRFDLVLLDMEMPEVDGFTVLAEMKQDLALRDVPVIVTSSLEGIDHVVRCIELGAEDYLHKPVNPVLLKARIGASLEKKRLRDQQKELLRQFASTRSRARPGAIGFRARRPARARERDVLRHPRLHAACRVAAARGDDRPSQQLLRADVRRDQRPRRHRDADGGRRADGGLRRAAARCPRTRKPPCARRWR